MIANANRTSKRLLAQVDSLRRRNAALEYMVADRRRLEKSIRASETRYRRIFEYAKDGILILDAHSGRIADVNRSFVEMSGFPTEDLLGKRLWEIAPFANVSSASVVLHQLREIGLACYEDLPFLTKDGRRLHIEFSSSIYSVDNGKVIQCNIHDITGSWHAQERLRYLGTHDELTGIHNRVFFDEELSRLSHSRQFPVTILIADVDGLKQINDRLGHAAGDQLLKEAAAVLQEAFRADEVVARTGGDEFVVLLPKTDEATAQAALHRVRNRLSFRNAARSEPLGLSLGAATADNSVSLGSALRHAEEQLYADKAAHRLEGPSSPSRDPQSVFRLIDAKLSARPGIHISTLASEMACERHVIERAVKAVKSMQFREYQQTRKLEAALHLLSGKPLLVKEVAGALGYTSPTSLWRLLKTRTMKSPKAIRGSPAEASTPDESKQSA